MTVNQLKNEIDKLVKNGFGNNRIMLNIDGGIRSALDETFVLLSDGENYE